MLNVLSHLTEDEKKELREQIIKSEQDSKVDFEELCQATDKVFINDLIHIQQMKNTMCENLGIKPLFFNADDYRRIGGKTTEEEIRKELREVFSEKLKNIKEDDILDLDKVKKFTSQFNINKTKGNKMTTSKGIDATQLKSFIERIERLEEEKANIQSDIREIYAEAKAFGYDPKIMKIVLKLRKMDERDRNELDELTETYAEAIGL